MTKIGDWITMINHYKDAINNLGAAAEDKEDETTTTRQAVGKCGEVEGEYERVLRYYQQVLGLREPARPGIRPTLDLQSVHNIK